MAPPSSRLRALVAVGLAALAWAGEVSEESCEQSPQDDETPLLQVKSRPSTDKIKLKQSDFDKGTYRITESGLYRITEDIVFDPRPDASAMSWSQMPADSQDYPQLAGYFLGFFAAITIEADYVELKCDGHEIKMSESFHKVQRFFSIVELGSAPFKAGQGPPQFASNLTTTGPLVSANNIVIKDCNFGLSAHHSIHGNDNKGVELSNLKMYDFEVGGISLNGAEDVVLEKLDIGPSLAKTWRAPLSQAVYLDHIANTIMTYDAQLNSLLDSTMVTLRGVDQSASSVLKNLRTELQKFVADTDGSLVPMFGKGDELPDGSAIYGILLHRSGIAINQFGALCADDNLTIEEKRMHNIYIGKVNIEGLKLKVEQTLMLQVEGQNVAGPAGDLFRVRDSWNPDPSCRTYVGNALADAQIAFGVVMEAAAEAHGATSDAVKFYRGSSYIPKKIQNWAAGKMDCATSVDFFQGAVEGKGNEKFACTGDSMNHFNKGVVGMRLGFQEDIAIEDVVIKDLSNEGVPDAAPYCVADDYMGTDVRGVAFAHLADLTELDIQMQKGSFTSTNMTNVIPFSGLFQMRADDAVVKAAPSATKK